MTEYNYYLQGRYWNNDAYHEKQDDYHAMQLAALEIQEADKEFVKMGAPENLANGVVRFIGLRMIQEVA